ncbi:hypothetical protein NM688_g6724 [Phlebia brevispora]|uniref:Uncharacterized protein n=1 Tax=Phlebia brevispora TaxID=194682 RepID=A0ACC1SD49_9APHY|nr:hypothetical protein NM688_g6724 [Phlebia brevispora]
MARFRCPSSTDSSKTAYEVPVDRPAVEILRPKGTRTNPKSRGKVKHVAKRAVVKERIRQFAKAKKVKQVLKLPTSKTVTLWIGNLPSDTTEGYLAGMFGKFGKIQEIIIRLSQGNVVCAGEVGNTCRSETQLYASVTMYSPAATTYAMDMDGTLLNGHMIRFSLDVNQIRRNVSELLDTHLEERQPTHLLTGQPGDRIL